jgi:hypothetical protein
MDAAERDIQGTTPDSPTKDITDRLPFDGQNGRHYCQKDLSVGHLLSGLAQVGD